MRRAHCLCSIPAALARAALLGVLLLASNGAASQTASAPAAVEGPVAITRVPSLALEQCAALCQQSADAALAKCDGHVAYVPGRDAQPQTPPNCRANLASAYRACASECKSRFGS